MFENGYKLMTILTSQVLVTLKILIMKIKLPLKL